MTISTRRRLVAGKIEAVEGTAETITVAETGILALDVSFDPDFKSYDRSGAVTGSLSKVEDVPGQKMGTLSFKAELKGAGAAYSASVKPALSPYLRCCGFAETVVTTAGAEKVTYLPASSGVPSMTLYYNWDGILYLLKGARGTVSFSGKIGEPVFAEFKFSGVYIPVTGATMLVPTFEATVPPVLLNTTLSIDGYAGKPETFSVDMGNQVSMRSDISAAMGYVSAVINDRSPTGKLDPEMALPATYDFMAKWAAGATGALAVGPVGAADYNRYTIGAPKCQYSKVGTGDRSGIGTADLAFKLCMVTGDDEFKLEFVK